MTATRCATKCGRPARGGVICPACTAELRGALLRVPVLVVELETVMARQTASGRSEGGRSSERPMAYGVDASNKLRDLTGALMHAARLLDPLTLETWRLGSALTAAWLVRNRDEIRQHEHAARMHEKITKAVKAAAVAIDRRPDRQYAGACGFDGDDREVACSAELYVEVGAAYVDCPSCGERWDVQERRDVLNAAVRDQLAIAATVAAALTYLDQGVSASTVRSWARRKVKLPDGRRFRAMDLDEKGRPLYRVGDALDIVAEAERRAVEVLGSHNVDISPSDVVEDSSLCNTPMTGTQVCPEPIEGGAS